MCENRHLGPTLLAEKLPEEQKAEIFNEENFSKLLTALLKQTPDEMTKLENDKELTKRKDNDYYPKLLINHKTERPQLSPSAVTDCNKIYDFRRRKLGNSESHPTSELLGLFSISIILIFLVGVAFLIAKTVKAAIMEKPIIVVRSISVKSD
jgi:hypothetical protein